MPHAPRIASRQHPIVRRFRRAAERRDDDDVVLLDGEHLIADAIAAHVPIDVVLTDGRHGAVAAAAAAAGAVVHDVPETVLSAASPVRSPSGIVALARWSPAPLERVLATARAPLLALVGVQDPGNAGSVVRTADAFGAGGVLLLDQSVDPSGWKSLRGAMGSTFRVPVGRGDTSALLDLAPRLGWKIAATAPRDATPIEQVDWSARWIVLLGSEGAGLPRVLADRADIRLTIPMRPGIDSLNVAATAAVIAFVGSGLALQHRQP